MPPTKDLQGPFSDKIKYPAKDVERMDGNWSLLAGAMGLKLVQPLRDLYWSESNHATKAMIDEYFSFRSSNFGWVAPPAGTKGANAAKPQAWIKNILTWYDKNKFLDTLSVDKREELDWDELNFPAKERANVYTLWYAVKLMKLQPALFIRSAKTLSQEPPKMDIYDALHASLILLSYAREMKKDNFSTKGKSFLTAKPPAVGAFGELASDSGTSGSASAVAARVQTSHLTEYYYGSLRNEQRELIMTTLGNPQGGYATEELVRRLTENIGKKFDHNVIEPPVVMDKEQIRKLLDNSIGQDFVRRSLIYEPEDMTSLPASKDEDMQTTEILVAGEHVVANFEEDAERMARSAAQTRSSIPGEIAPPIRQTAAWADQTREMRLNQVSAPSWPLEEACQFAGIPIENNAPVLRPVDDQYGKVTELQPWQPAAIAWLLWQLETPLRGGILADACGLSKTLTSLCLVYFAVRRLIQANQQVVDMAQRVKYHATLIVVPARVLLQWVSQIDNFFGNQFDVIIFWGNPEHIGDPTRKERTVKSTDELLTRLFALDPSNPKTAYTIVVTSYDTMRMRTTKPLDGDDSDNDGEDEQGDLTYDQGLSDEPRQGAGVSAEAEILADAQLRAGVNEDDMTENPDDAVKKRKVKPQKKYRSTCPYTWEHVILDECQHIKSIRTRQHQSIALLKRNAFIGLTGTPMWNKVADLYGYFSLLAGGLTFDPTDSWPDLPIPDDTNPPPREPESLYMAWSQVRSLPRDPARIPYQLLCPSALLCIAPGGDISPGTAHECFPFLFRAAIMMRSMGDKIIGFGGQEVIIGQEIPPIRVMTVEVRFLPGDQRWHDERYEELIKKIAKGDPEGGEAGAQADPDAPDEGEGRLNMGVLRHLSLLGFSLFLDNYLTGAGASESVSEAIGRLVGAKDHGFTAFFEATCSSRAVLRPPDSIYQVHYLITHSPRLQQLLRIMDAEGAFSDTTPHPRFLILSHWPIVCWLVEMVLKRIGFRSVSITAAKSPEERAAAAADFTNPNSACQVLNTTYNTGGTGLNLHTCCNIVILMEPAPNFNLETQAMGRVHRIGQPRAQKAYRLHQDHTICRWVTGNNIRKMLPQLAAQFSEPFAEEVDRRMPLIKAQSIMRNPTDGDTILEDVVDEDRLRRMRLATLDDICEDHLRRMIGVCEDFPFHYQLLPKKKLGLKTVDAKAAGFGDFGKVKTSNRESFLARGKGPITAAKRQAINFDDASGGSRGRKRRRVLGQAKPKSTQSTHTSSSKGLQTTTEDLTEEPEDQTEEPEDPTEEPEDSIEKMTDPTKETTDANSLCLASVVDADPQTTISGATVSASDPPNVGLFSTPSTQNPPAKTPSTNQARPFPNSDDRANPSLTPKDSSSGE